MDTEIENILKKLLSNKEEISLEEQDLFDIWMQDANHQQEFYELKRIESGIYAVGMGKKINCEEGWKRVCGQLKTSTKIFRLLPYAAAILIMGLGITLWFLMEYPQMPSTTITIGQEISQSLPKVMLTLSTGQQIALSDSLSPMIETNGTSIKKIGNQLVYNTTDTASVLVYNTITVPRGGEYKLALSDGSIIWLNSESELTYPVNFGRDKREITLTGEAFFEVQKDTTRPFIVRTNQFAIRVTGTRFNVRNYARETASATLAEGSIQLEENNRVTPLRPGQQASWVEGEVQVKEIDIEEAIAWRYGAFCFKQRRLESLLDEIARWYDLEIRYQDTATRDYHFTAWFRRNTPLQELIGILEKTQQIKLELKGKTLIVKTNHI